MKLNYIGIIGSILALFSIALPWWTLSINLLEIITSSTNLYLYQISGTFGTVALNTSDSWFCWVALAFVIIGGILGIIGSVTGYGDKMLIGGGVFTLLSIIIFAAGLQMWLSSSGGVIHIFTNTMGYSSYLSYGFWIALVAMILMFVAVTIKPQEKAAQPSPTQS
ncbi:hypothetical protein HXY33_01180 [Candidatus Bathyarchaeota archaeon]|nr:hypothetical protein [Candidatus Bathyarchaeota archaeon]